MAKLKAPFALDRSLNTTEQTSRNIADVLAEELSAIITALGGLNFINYEVVQELPTTEISTTTIYLVPSDDPQSGNTYDEYINLNGTVSGWEKIGSTAIDLSGYYTSAETDALLDEKVDKDSFDEQTATDEFSTINGGLLSECKVALSPNQDLHGYDEPWVGGAGKNKLPLVLADIKSNNTQGTWSGNSYTYNGVTFTVNTDIDGNVTGIETSGTASSNGSFYLCNGLTLDSGYILNGCPSTGGSSTYRVRLRYGSSDYFVDTGSGAEITTPVTSYGSIDIRFNSGTNLSGLTFYPMIRLATESDPTFEPYSNICPISGHTQVVVGDDGKNCLPNDATDQTVSGVEFKKNNDGSLTLNGQSTADWAGITLTSAKFLKAGTYTVSCPRVNGVDTRLIISYDGAEKVNTYNVDYKTFTLTEDKTISVRLVIRNSGVSFSNVTYYPMIEKGSIKTDYVPYNGYQVTVNLGGTYYSGTLDVVTGVFTPDTAEKDLSTLTFRSASRNRWLSEGVIAEVKHPSESSIKIKFWSDSYYYTDANTLYGNQSLIGIAIDSGGNILCRNNDTNPPTGHIVYELATPQSIQLSPTTVKALVGENHLSAPLDGQEITESKYKKMFTFDDVIAYIQSLS